MTRVRIRKPARRRYQDTTIPEGQPGAPATRTALLGAIGALLAEIDRALDEARS